MIIQPKYCKERDKPLAKGDRYISITGALMCQPIHKITLDGKDIQQICNLLDSESGTKYLKDWLNMSVLTRFSPEDLEYDDE
jgi:hypothetical protein